MPHEKTLPIADEVHISVAFTWHVDYSYHLLDAWRKHYPTVRIGGPAIDTTPPDDFTPGLYLKPGLTITSRGCIYNCPWCLVSQREGPLRTIPIRDGYIIQDNNLLACPREHIERVFEMCARVSHDQRQIDFRGGFAAHLLEPWHADLLRQIRIRRIFTAADTISSLEHLKPFREMLHWLRRHELRCYILCAYNGETIPEAEARIVKAYQAGFWPYPSLYQPPSSERIEYSSAWKELARTWARPVLAWHRATELGLCK